LKLAEVVALVLSGTDSSIKSLVSFGVYDLLSPSPCGSLLQFAVGGGILVDELRKRYGLFLLLGAG
jgi:hypothetical protein